MGRYSQSLFEKGKGLGGMVPKERGLHSLFCRLYQQYLRLAASRFDERPHLGDGLGSQQS